MSLRGGRWAAPALTWRQLLYGVHPVGRYTAASVDLGTTRNLSGHDGQQFRGGERSDPTMRFSGDLGVQQDFRGGAFVGKSRNLRRSGEDRALPATSAAAGNPVLAALAATMPLSAGTKRA